MTARVWRAGPAEAPAVAALMAEFRDWLGRDGPTDRDLAESVERLIEDPGTEYLLGSRGSGASGDSGGGPDSSPRPDGGNSGPDVANSGPDVGNTEPEVGNLGPDVGNPAPDGVCQLRFRYGVWHSAEDCWLEDLFVREGARGSGLGRALVEAAVERARARGCERIDLDAASDNDAALGLYGRLGFTADTGTGGSLLLLRRRLDS